MNKGTYSWIWIFIDVVTPYPPVVFASLDQSVRWIAERKLTGTLTAYPVGLSVYDWALAENLFGPKRPEQRESRFIQRFSSGSQPHFHFEFGGGSNSPEIWRQISNDGLRGYEGNQIWVFVGEGGRFPAGAFRSEESALAWVTASGASGKIVWLGMMSTF